MNHTAPQGSILGTDFPVGDINVEACDGLLKGVLEAFILPPTDRNYNSITTRVFKTYIVYLYYHSP